MCVSVRGLKFLHNWLRVQEILLSGVLESAEYKVSGLIAVNSWS